MKKPAKLGMWIVVLVVCSLLFIDIAGAQQCPSSESSCCLGPMCLGPYTHQGSCYDSSSCSDWQMPAFPSSCPPEWEEHQGIDCAPGSYCADATCALPSSTSSHCAAAGGYWTTPCSTAAGGICNGDCCLSANAGAETCDGHDNDCNGQTDEGFDLQTDPNNCGSCDNACAAGEGCTAGVCTPPQILTQCSDSLDNDNNGCADYPTDSGCYGFDDSSESGGICPVTPSDESDTDFAICHTPECLALILYPLAVFGVYEPVPAMPLPGSRLTTFAVKVSGITANPGDVLRCDIERSYGSILTLEETITIPVIDGEETLYHEITLTEEQFIDKTKPWKIAECSLESGGGVTQISGLIGKMILTHLNTWTAYNTMDDDVFRAILCEAGYPNQYFANVFKCDLDGDVVYALGKVRGVEHEENCEDGIDNEGDSLIDCDDPDCHGIPYTTLCKMHEVIE